MGKQVALRVSRPTRRHPEENSLGNLKVKRPRSIREWYRPLPDSRLRHQLTQTPKTYTPQESLLYLFNILSYLPRTGGYHGSSGEDAPLPWIVSRSGYRAISGAAQPISALSVKNASLVGGGIRSDRRTADQPSVRRVFRLAGSVRVRPVRGGGQPAESAR